MEISHYGDPMLGSTFIADRRIAGAAQPCNGSVFRESDPVCLTATALREGVEKRILIESAPGVDDAYFDAAEVLIASLRGAEARTLQKFDILLQRLLANFSERPDIHDTRFAVPHSRDRSPEPVKTNVFPVALIAELLTVWKLRLDMTRVPNWRAFALRHGSALLA